MNKEKKDKNIVLLSIGMIMIVVGLISPGLWPYQLPLCFIGGFLIGIS